MRGVPDWVQHLSDARTEARAPNTILVRPRQIAACAHIGQVSILPYKVMYRQSGLFAFFPLALMTSGRKSVLQFPIATISACPYICGYFSFFCFCFFFFWTVPCHSILNSYYIYYARSYNTWMLSFPILSYFP